MRRLHFSFFLILLAFPHRSFAVCSSGLEYFFPYRSCRDKSHGYVPRMERASHCGVEKYKLCTIHRVVTFHEEFVTHLNESNPDRRSFSRACEKGALTAHDMQRWPQGYRFAYDHAVDAYNTQFSLPENEKDEVTQAVRQIPPQIEVISSANWGNHELKRDWYNVKCETSDRFDIPLLRVDPSCGVETYKLCPAPYNGTEPFIEKSSEVCGIDWWNSFLYVYTNGNFDRSGGKHECTSFEHLPESTSEERDKKISHISYILGRIEHVLAGTGKYGQETAEIYFTLYRLQNLQSETGAMNETRRRINELINQFPLPFVINGRPSEKARYETMIDSFVKDRKTEALQSLPYVFPDKLDELANGRSDYASMLGDKFATIFYKNGLVLDDFSLANAKKLLSTYRKYSTSVYRIAESIIRSDLAAIKEIEEKIPKFLAIKNQFYRSDISTASFDEIVGHPEDDDLQDLRQQFAAWKEEKSDLQKMAQEFINNRVSVLHERVNSIRHEMTEVRNMADAISKDPRLPLLDGYLALLDMDGVRFSNAFKAVNLDSAKSVLEMQLSRQLLAESANAKIVMVDALMSALSRSQEDYQKLGATFMNSLPTILARGSGDVNIMDALTKAVGSFDGSEDGVTKVQSLLLSLLRDTMEEFRQSIRAIPNVNWSEPSN